MIKRVIRTQNIPMFVVGLWAVIYFINAMTVKNAPISDAHDYLYVFICFWVTAQTLHKAITTHDNSVLLYGALGFCCLALGYFYFLIISITSIELDYISIGNFSTICCYLFFLSALMALRESRLARHKIFNITVNVFAAAAAVTSALAVIINNPAVIHMASILLDGICIVTAGSLLINKNRGENFFAVMMLIVAACDLVGGLGFVTVISLLIAAFAPVIYLLMGRSLILTKEGGIV